MLKKKNSALDTRKKGGKAPPDVTFDDVVKNLLEYFKGFKVLQDAESEIKKKYNIDKNTTVWNEDDVKKAWGKTQRMNKYSRRRKTWSLAIILQAIYVGPQIKSKKRSFHPSGNNKDDDSTLDTRSNVRIEVRPNAGTESHDFTIGNTPDLNVRPNAFVTNDNNTMVRKRITNTSLNSGCYETQPETVYMRIPLSFMDVSDATSCQQAEKKTCKLIDGVPSLTQTMKKTSYVVQYDNRTRNAAWVFEILKKRKEKEKEDQPIRSNTFLQDSMIHKHYTTPHKESYEKPYDRGHLAAAANHNWSQKAMDDTFLISNIAPQNSDLNRNAWRELEQKCRDYTEDYKNVYVYTGPLYCPERCLTCNKTDYKHEIIGGKVVPTHFFKVIILEKDDGTLDVKCYKVANADPQQTYVETQQKYVETQLDDIEKLSGLVFSEKSQFVSNEERVTVQWRAQETGETHSIDTTFTITPSQDSTENLF